MNYSLSPKTAFIVDIPGDHRYYLPVTSSEWEVLYIEFSKDALPFWRQLLTLSEPVFQLSAQSDLMAKAWNMYEMALDDRFHAVKLLLSTTDNLESIAEQTGFSCANYFGEMFRKHKGISPGSYREKNMTHDIQRVFYKR
ncbi:helix-turn-helix domain-containing protein [Paenibacillus sp. FA6]|uniref:helix-turn-helix domain-containing protein n=1 Tax=Paenibacillus sp. FA6 TaxID=3413029 RepID=UPI003F65A434